ncbi:MAG: N-acyl homoserine lactonase family protein [Candidatus Dormibacteraeota bacterium]|uniref:N-acyl homoserine lactonase family protein n=2 Tax=Candidatus Dormibacteria TaxID=3126996 RepID=A0A934N9K1_9BACT|nr:N-acyl homoserine lactonase family protein [Candidatus Dormibacteraeota bacterium]MBJ7603967.1 N-acyl homoserine lactonase family protein [Candidatus Dormibacteraeota bacterium]MBJ7607154.1 N-acyl homoserine lactonase family protein [Candidatus Dormibacteraeota bacterium]
MSISITVLECGHTTLDYELAVTGSPDEMLTAVRTQNHRRLLTHPIYAYVIEHPEGRMIVDTGVSSGFQKQWKKGFYAGAMAYDSGSDGSFVQRLEQKGWSPENFDWVVLSHLHTDHAGNAPIFKDAGSKILVHEDELRGAVTVKGSLVRDDDVTLWGVTSQQGFVRANWGFLVPDRATTVYGDVEVMKGVWVVSIPGHTWGTVGVAVRLERQGWVLMASDAIYLADTYRKPFVGSILNQNQELWARSAQKIRRMAEQYDMQILPGHDDKCIQGLQDGLPTVNQIADRYE